MARRSKPGPKPRPVEDRLYAACSVDTNTPKLNGKHCLICSLVKLKGYPQIYYEGATWYANRVVWVLAKGPIPRGKLILHRCDNPPCVEINHLFVGTHWDNMQDMAIKGRKKTGAALPQTKLSPMEVLNIFNSDQTTRALASIYGVSQAQISRIKSGLSQSELTAKYRH